MQKEPTRTRASKKHSNVKKDEVPFEGRKMLPLRRGNKIRRRARFNWRTGRSDNNYGVDAGTSTKH